MRILRIPLLSLMIALPAGAAPAAAATAVPATTPTVPPITAAPATSPAVVSATPTAAPSATPTPSDRPLADTGLVPSGASLRPPTLAAALRALHSGQPESAARDLTRLRASGVLVSPAEAHFLVGRAWLAADRPEFAVLPLRQAARDYDVLGDYALFYLGEANLALERADGASEAFQRLLVDYPQSVLAARARLRMADSLVLQGQFARAHDLFQQALDEGNSGTPADEILYRIGDSLARDGKVDDAANTWFKLWRDHPAADAARRAEAALDGLAAAGLRVPSRTAADARYKHALALASANKALDAVAEIDSLVAQRARLPGNYRLERARLLFKARDYPQAKKEFERLTMVAPPGAERAESMYWFGRSLARLDDYPGAHKEFEKLRSQYPKLSFSRDSLFKEGLMALEGKDFASSAHLFELYTHTYPTAVDADEALWYQGWSQYRAKRFAVANATFHYLAEKYPRSQLAERARYWTGRAQVLSGQKEQGIATLSALALEQQLTYYGLLSGGALADLGVDVPFGAGGDSATPELENPDEPLDSGSEAPDIADAPGWSRDNDDPVQVVPPAAYQFHFQRARNLVRLGYQQEAALELASARGAAVTRTQKLDLAHMAIAADYYHGAQNIARLAFGDELERSHGEGEIVRLAYPKAWPHLVTNYAGQYKYSPSVLWAIMREESTYKPDAVSPVGALGLLQIMPKTANQIAVSLGVKGFTCEQLFDPETSIGFSAWYVRTLLGHYGGNEALAIASYNAGPEAVDRWLKARGDLALDEFVEEIPFTETRRYVKKVMMSYGVYEALYGPGAPKIRAGHPVVKGPLLTANMPSAFPDPVPVPGTATAVPR